jgi:ABC-2 type transport system permease protein
MKVIKIIKREFLTKVFTKGFLIGTLLGPIFILGLTFAPAYFMSLSTEQPMTVRLVDHTASLADDISQAFSDTLKNGQPRFIFSEIEPDIYSIMREEIRDDILKKNVDVVLEIPTTILNGGSINYLARSVSDLDLIQKFRNGISQVIQNIRIKNAGIDPELIQKLVERIDIRTIKVEKGKVRERGFGQEYISSVMFLLILYMTILLYGNNVMRSVIEEKMSRIIEVLLSSTNSFQLMLGKLLGVGFAGIVQYIIWSLMAMGVFLFATTSMPNVAEYISVTPTLLFYFVVFFIVGFFTFATLYAAVGAVCSDMQDAQSLSGPITIMVIIPFMVSFMVVRDPSSDIARILSLIPFFAPMIMFMRISLVLPPLWEILISLMINILTILLIIWISAKIYRIGILMYGKRPTVPEVIRWIRYK